MVWGRLCMLIILQKRRNPTSAIAMSWMLTCRDATLIRTIVPARGFGYVDGSANRRDELPFLGMFLRNIKGPQWTLKIYFGGLLCWTATKHPFVSYIATICAVLVKVFIHTNRSLTCADLSSQTGKICARDTLSIHHLSK